MKEKIPTMARETIGAIAAQFKFEIINGEIDLRERSSEEVVSFLKALRDTERFLFHGSNSQEKYEVVEVRQGKDAAKESGNKKAVYADEGAIVPLALAVLNKNFLRNKLKHYIAGWSGNEEGKIIFKFDQNILNLFKANDPELFSDGYVYVFERTGFVNAEDAGAEWHSESDQKPSLSCRVSKRLAGQIFIYGQGESDTVAEYSPEELREIESFDQNKK